MAAAPSLAWGLAGADYLTDDFAVANLFEELGVLEATVELSFRGPARPLVGPYYLLAYQVVGDRPFVHALVMAVLNGALVVLLWHALRAVVSARVALLAALVFAVVPNRGSTRLWFVLGPNLVALACVALGAFLLLRRRNVAAAVALFVIGVLGYEGVAGVAGVTIAWWWFEDRAARARAAVLALAPVALATVASWLLSPKRDGRSPGSLDNLDTLPPAQLGSGFWGSELAGTFGRIVVVAAVTWAVATLLPSFRTQAPELRRSILVGAVLFVVGAVPFVVGGAPFAVRGIFDRNNLVADVGTCLVVGSLLAAAIARRRPVGLALAGVVVVLLAAPNLHDVRDYRDAAREGDALVAAVLADVDPTMGTVVVTPPLPGDTGVAQFILNGDLTAALALRHGRRWSSVAMPFERTRCVELVEEAAADGRPSFLYDRLERTIVPMEDAEACPAQ